MTLALVILESTMRLVSKLNLDPVLAERRVQAFLAAAQIRLAPMDGMTASLAVEALADCWQGRGRQAQLNLADCLSYACAKAQGVPLLYKGKDFFHTDLAFTETRAAPIDV